MGESILTLIVALGIIIYLFRPVDKNSTSYRLGHGLGRKTRKLGKWIMDENE